jgi:Ras-related protein Rab-8A
VTQFTLKLTDDSNLNQPKPQVNNITMFQQKSPIEDCNGPFSPIGCDVDGIIKVLLIGNSSVGKSCMLARYSEGEFPEGQKATIGIDFKLRQLDIDGRIVKLQIWDTAGQEQFRTITRAYYRGAAGVLIIYDVTDEKSFRDVNNWYISVEENTGPETVVVLCANKCDIDIKEDESPGVVENENAQERKEEEEEEEEEKEYVSQPRRVVSAERGQALANEFKIPYFETSAKDDVGVDELFLEISKLCLNRSKSENERRKKVYNKKKLKLNGKNRRNNENSCC